MPTNNPAFAALGNMSNHNILVLILAELRLHTELMFQREVREDDIEGLRAEVMAALPYVDTESLTALPQSAP